MAALSIGQAFRHSAGAVRRNPGAVAIWVVLYLIFGVGPSLLIWWVAGGDYVDMIRSLFQSGGKFDPVVVAAVNAKIGWISNLNLLIQLVWLSVTGAAMFRMVLRPQARGFGFIRFGVAELCIGAVIVILYLALIALVVVLTLIAVVAVVIGMNSVGAGVALGLGVTLIALLACAWAYIRLSLALPMIVDDDRFRLFEAWRVSRPVWGRLILLVLAMAGIWLLLTLVVVLLYAVVFTSAVSASGLGWGGYFGRPGAQVAHDIVPLMTAMAALSVCVSAPTQALCAGAWADAYRQLAPGRSVDEVFA